MVTTNDFNVYSRLEYFRQLTADIEKTGNNDRVIVTTMTFDPEEPPVAKLLLALNAAAKRGAQVHLAVDAFPFMIERKGLPGPLWFGKKLPAKHMREPFRKRFVSLETLKASGGHYAIVNRPGRTFSLPHAGRCHIKTAIINNRVYVGGCNLALPDQIDVMVGWRDERTAEWLAAQVYHVMETGQTQAAFDGRDSEKRLDSQNRLIIDAGVRRQSRIYDEAVALMEAAQEWIFITCQFFPGGQTGQHLLEAQRRGVKVQVIYGHPSHHGSEALGHYLYNLRERIRLPVDLFEHRLAKGMIMLHAKVLATDRGVLVGSHNLTTQGVRLGTAEMALLSSDEALTRKIVQSLLDQLSQAGVRLN